MIKINYWQIFSGTMKVLLDLWPLWVILLIVVGVRLFFDWLDLEIDNWHIRRRFKKGGQWRSDRDLIYWLRGMSPTEFEQYIAELFRRLGYMTKSVGGSYDGGVDVIAEKDGVKHYIQCKKYFSKHVVGSPEIREFYGALADHYGNGEGWFIATNKFSPEAEKFAEDKPIILINQFKLAEYIRSAEKLGFDSRSQAKTDLNCPKCDGLLVERNGKFGKFLGCSNFPKCEFTKKLEN